MWRLAFEALGAAVHVAWEPAALMPPLRALTSSYAECERDAALDYRITGGPPYELTRNGSVVYRTSELDDLPPAFELDLYRELVELGSRAGWVLHAAAAVRDRGAIVLYGDPGAGKSTLVHELVRRGSRYLSDEWAVLGGDGEVRGIARPITLEPTAVAGNAEGWSTFRYVLRAGDGSSVESLLVHPPASRLARGPSRLLALVHLTRERHARAVLERLGPEQALRSCFESTLPGGAGAAAIALRVVARTPVFRLSAGPVAACSGMLEQLWTEA
jgi:hypothetical protein